MSKWIAGLAIAVFAATLSFDAEAQRRLGGGMSFGKPSQTLQQRRIGLFQVPRRANFGGNGGSGGHTRARVLAAA